MWQLLENGGILVVADADRAGTESSVAAARNCQNPSDLCAQWSAAVEVGRQIAYVSLCSGVGLRSAALGELEEELLNFLAACIGEIPVLADNLEPVVRRLDSALTVLPASRLA